MRTYDEAVKITVDWWVEKSFNTPLNQNNGDDSPSGGLAFGLMNILATRLQEKVTPEQIEIFKKALAEELMKFKNSKRFVAICSVDYAPNETLAKACEKARINPGVLPCKTNTIIKDNNQIEGRYQYGGDWFII